jgi:hypothetical protein
MVSCQVPLGGSTLVASRQPVVTRETLLLVSSTSSSRDKGLRDSAGWVAETESHLFQPPPVCHPVVYLSVLQAKRVVRQKGSVNHPLPSVVRGTVTQRKASREGLFISSACYGETAISGRLRRGKEHCCEALGWQNGMTPCVTIGYLL